MQDSTSGGGGSSGGGGGPNELTRTSGLARFRSAPATWLDALLEDSDDSLKLSGPLNQPGLGLGLTQLLTSTTNTSSIGPSSSSAGPSAQQQQSYNDINSYFESGTHNHHHHHQQQQQQNANTVAFQRMNSSPAEFLSANIEGYFSSFGGFDFEVDGGGGGPSSSKRLRDDNDTSDFSSLRRGEQSGQLSTANSLVELEMEKLLEDSVPCRVRAKRGCATHPRSIAERVRRTRISDRIRKLQELVPNMDKQTNTADMLDEAVEYVKTLQRQIHELTEQQKKCKCIAKS